MHDNERERLEYELKRDSPTGLRDKVVGYATACVLDALEPAIDSIVADAVRNARELERARADKLLAALEQHCQDQADRFTETVVTNPPGTYPHAVGMEKTATYLSCSMQIMELRRILSLRRERKMEPYALLPPAPPNTPQQRQMSQNTGLLNLITPEDLKFDLDRSRFLERGETMKVFALAIQHAYTNGFGEPFSPDQILAVMMTLGYVDAALSHGVKQ